MVARNSMAEQRINHVAPRSAGCTRDVTSDSLACFAGVTDAGGNPLTIIVVARQPKHLSEFKPAKAALRNLKSSFVGTYHAFNFAKCGARYHATLVYRLDRCFHLDTIQFRLIVTATIGPRLVCLIRQTEGSC